MPIPTSRLHRSLGIVAACAIAGSVMLAQTPGGQPATPVNASSDPLLQSFVFRSIGPATMGGRVDDIEGVIDDPLTIWVGLATGGLWKTTNGGRTWTSMFDEMPNSSVGDIAIAPSDSRVVYVGMGEPNNRQSSTIGNGVYVTRDGGRQWTHLGLEDTQSIGRIAVHPKDPNTAYVAAVGHLFGPNEERGLYKTVDGGKTWIKSKYIDADTGFIDVAIDPVNPNNVYAASYQRRRTWWGFNGGGPNSGLWKSTDAGKSWTKVQGAGWPEPKDNIIGRIGIDIHRAKPSVIYAHVEVGASGGTGAGVADDGGPARGGRGGGGGGRGAAPGTPPPPPDPQRSGVWRSDDGGKSWRLASNENNRPMYYSQIRVDPANDQKLLVGGASAQMSLDGGREWRGFSGTGHGDYHAFWISPKDPRIVWTGHDGGIDVSYDGGLTWDYLSNMPLGQFYQVSADMRRPYHVCGGLQDNGSWCGPSAVRSGNGAVNTDWYNVGGGDGFYTRNDPTDYTIIYSESQNGNVNRLNLRDGSQQSIRPSLGGGGGGGGAQAGNILNPPPGADAFRFNWNAPLEISPHNPATIYYGAQYFFKSPNRGDTWWMNPTDLTKNVDRFANPIMGVPGRAPMASKHDGYANNSNITIIRESPARPGVIWVGTDDGNVHVSQDGGQSFTNVYGNIAGAPRMETQISRIEPSNFDAGTAYVSIDAHRFDDWKPYLFKTTDYGRTWTAVSGNLPARGHINAVEEDFVNPNLIFVGTEFGLFVTLDGGRDWRPFMTGLPRVRIDDLLIHPREGDLIVATHGRSFWIADDITPLQQLGARTVAPKLFDPRPAVLWKNDREETRRVTARQFRADNPQGGTAISFLAGGAGEARLQILDASGRAIRTQTIPAQAGLNRWQWDLMSDPPQLTPEQQAQLAQFAGRGGGGGGRGGGPAGVPFVIGGGRGGGGRGGGQPSGAVVAPGTYVVRLTLNSQTMTTAVTVLEDVWMVK